VLPAGGIGAPHKRDRLFFVANSHSERLQRRQEARQQCSKFECDNRSEIRPFARSSAAVSTVADSHNERHERSSSDGRQAQRGSEHSSNISLAYSNASQLQGGGLSCGIDSQHHSIRRDEAYSCLGDTEHDGSYEAKIGRSTGSGEAKGGMLEPERSDSLFWGSSEVIYCRDGKYRPIPTEPALFPLANGISNRVGILRGAGNAIVPQAAAEIIKAYLHD
jgi:DNA (cytosine-5)-methyltransferase 1